MHVFSSDNLFDKALIYVTYVEYRNKYAEIVDYEQTHWTNLHFQAIPQNDCGRTLTAVQNHVQ